MPKKAEIDDAAYCSDRLSRKSVWDAIVWMTTDEMKIVVGYDGFEREYELLI